jgi:flagellar hook-associated protein 1 FlgK
MQSTFSGIELGKRGLVSHTQGLSTIGHNLSNASTEGYSRQRIRLNPTDPLYVPGLSREETPGQIGQGTDIARIERIRDDLLEGRIVAQANGENYWQTRDKYLLMVEKIYNEPMDVSIRSHLDRFWSAWQELSIHPSEMAARMATLERGKNPHRCHPYPVPLPETNEGHDRGRNQGDRGGGKQYSEGYRSPQRSNFEIQGNG